MSFRPVIMTGSTVQVVYQRPNTTWNIQTVFGGPDGLANPFNLTNFGTGALGSTCILNFSGNASQWFTNRVVTLNMQVPGIDENVPLQVTMVSPAVRARQAFARSREVTKELDQLARDLTELFPDNQVCESHPERAEHSAYPHAERDSSS